MAVAVTVAAAVVLVVAMAVAVDLRWLCGGSAVALRWLWRWLWRSVHSCSFFVQRNPAIAHFKGPVDFMPYCDFSLDYCSSATLASSILLLLMTPFLFSQFLILPHPALSRLPIQIPRSMESTAASALAALLTQAKARSFSESSTVSNASTASTLSAIEGVRMEDGKIDIFVDVVVVNDVIVVVVVF